jgi:ribosomal-protein-alanine N-acetyltransferase
MNDPEQGLYVHWMTDMDLPEVLDIEGECFPANSWTERDFRNCLKSRKNVGTVIEDHLGCQAVGFCIYRMHKNFYELLSLAVRPHFRRRGFGKTLLTRLADKLTGKRRAILLRVRETNLDAQLFFKALGFSATKVLRRYYSDTREDAYLFKFKPRLVKVNAHHAQSYTDPRD